MTEDQKQSRRRFLEATGTAAAALVLAGCTGGGNNDTTTSGGTTGSGATSAEATTTSMGETTSGATSMGETSMGETTTGEGTAMGETTTGEGTAMGENTTGEGTAMGENTTGEGTAMGENTTGEGTTMAENTTGNGTGTAMPQPEFEVDTSKTFKPPTIGKPTTFDPPAATDTESGRVIQNVFDALTNYEDGNTAASNLLAESYEVSDGGTTYTFKLTDATFHNGDTVTSKDFAYAFERVAGSDHTRRASYILDTIGIKHETTKTTDSDGNEQEVYKPGSLAMKTPDDKTFEFTLSKPFHAAIQMVAYTAFSAIPEGIVGDVEGYDGEMDYKKFANKNPIGAGPFKFETWKKGKYVEVSRFDDYHVGKPTVAGVHWQIFTDPTAGYNYAMNQNVDQFGIPTSKYEQKKVNFEDESTTLKTGTYGPVRNGMTVDMTRTLPVNTYYIGFNMTAVPKPVRQAFAYVTNQTQFVEKVFKGRGVAAYYLAPPNAFPGGAENYNKTAKANYPYGYQKSSVQKAKQVMEKAGYSQSKKFSIEVTSYTSPVWKQMLNLLQSKLRPAHIDMSITKVPFNTLIKKGRNGKLEGYTLGWVADWPEADNFEQLIYPPNTDTSKPGPKTYINWSSDNGDAAEKATKAYETVLDHESPSDSDTSAREDAYMKIEQANWEDVGILPIYSGYDDFFSYPWAAVPPAGGMGASRQKYDNVKIAKKRTKNP